MSRTVIACRGLLAGAAGAVLLAACGGDDNSDSASSTTAGAAEATETSTGSGGSDFCTQAADIDQRVEEGLSGLHDDDPSVPDAFRQIAEELRNIEAPAAISSDWESLAGGLDGMADAFADFDVTDPQSLNALDDAESRLSSASTNVENYLRDECGITP
jgi:hypothetical protein